jgi:TolB-like protein
MMARGLAPLWRCATAASLRRRVPALLLALLPCVHVSIASAQTKPEAARPRIAVLEFASVEATKAETAAVTDEVRNDLFKSGRFEVLERTEIDAVLNEQALQQAAAEPIDAVKAGKLLSVHYIVTGRLTRPSPEIYQLSVQAIDVETGKVTASETTHHEGAIMGLLDKLPELTSQAVAHLFGEEPTRETKQEAAPAPPPAASQPTPEQPQLLRIFGAPLTDLKLSLAGPASATDAVEVIAASGISVGYERSFTTHIAGSVTLHLSRVTQVEFSPPGQPTRKVGATGSFNMVSLGLKYDWFPGDWVLFAGGEVYFAALDYRVADYLFSGGQETSWTVSASGLAFRVGGDYVLDKHWFTGLAAEGDAYTHFSGSRIDAYDRNGGLNADNSTLTTVFLRVGYQF